MDGERDAFPAQDLRQAVAWRVRRDQYRVRARGGDGRDGGDEAPVCRAGHGDALPRPDPRRAGGDQPGQFGPGDRTVLVDQRHPGTRPGRDAAGSPRPIGVLRTRGRPTPHVVEPRQNIARVGFALFHDNLAVYAADLPDLRVLRSLAAEATFVVRLEHQHSLTSTYAVQITGNPAPATLYSPEQQRERG